MTNPNVMKEKISMYHQIIENASLHQNLRKLLVVEKEGTNEYDFKATKRRIKYAKKLLKELKKELKEEKERLRRK